MRNFYILFTIGILFLCSCEIINPDEGIPAKLAVDNVFFNSEVQQGTDSAEISDIWIYVDNDLIGAFEIPFKAPILATGNHNVKLRPGVILNGIAATRSINPFYTSVYKTIDFIPGEFTTINPKFEYVTGVKFPWNAKGEEDFEAGGISIDSIAGTSAKIFKSNAEVYQGDYSGEISLDQGHKTFRAKSSNSFVLPKGGAYVIMEMNIKNQETPLYIGMYVLLPGNTVKDASHLMIKSGQNWKKLYINFTELVSYYPNAISYNVSFKADLGSLDSAKIFLDNIKIMHF